MNEMTIPKGPSKRPRKNHVQPLFPFFRAMIDDAIPHIIQKNNTHNALMINK